MTGTAGFTGERRTYIPPAFGKAPETPAEALEAAAAVLEEEGRWKQGAWFEHDDTEHPEYRDDPYCNGWGTCADGALQIVTLGVELFIPPRPCVTDDCDACVPSWCAGSQPEQPNPNIPGAELYAAARRQLEDTLAATYGELLRHIPKFNDRRATTRDEVVSVLRAAAAGAANNETEPPK